MGIKLELEVDEINYALIGLSKLPYEVSAAVIDKVRTQTLPQVNQAANDAVKPTVEDTTPPVPQLLTE